MVGVIDQMEDKTSPTISDQKWHRSELRTNVSRITRRVFRTPRSLFFDWNMPSHVTYYSPSVHSLLCSKRSSAVCLRSHPQNCINRKRSPGNWNIFREYRYGCHWNSINTSKTVPWEFKSSHAISPELYMFLFFEAVIMTSWAAVVSMRGGKTCRWLRCC
jgi:hypothetical protein